MLEGLEEWLLDHLSWIVLPIIGYFIINLILWGSKKGVRRVFWKTGEEERGFLDIHNLVILILIVILVLLIWRR